MKVLLIYPVPPAAAWPQGFFRSRWVPTGIAQIAAELRHVGHDVRIHLREQRLIENRFDWPAAELDLRRELVEFAPDIVGLSVLTPAVAETAMIAALAKELIGPHVLTVSGGAHPTAMPDEMLDECPALDAVAVGEAEDTMVELAGGGPSPEVAGLLYRRDGEIVRTPARPPRRDLDSFQPIGYDLFDMAYHTAPDRWLIRWLKLSALNLRTSRGCTGRCKFCAGYLVAGLGVRMHSIERVVDDLERAADDFGVQAVLFEDETLGANRKRLMNLCELMQSRGLHRKLKWSACLRVDQADAELLARMKAAGCIQIEYGFESGSQAMLRRLGKNTTVEQNRRAVRLTREAKLRIFADIMVALPGETAEDFRSTIRFLRWAKPDVLSATRLYPLPGTAIFNDLPADTRRNIAWGDYAYHNDPRFAANLTAMTDDELATRYRRFQKYVVHPTIARQVLRDARGEDPGPWRKARRHARRFAIRHPLRRLRLPV